MTIYNSTIRSLPIQDGPIDGWIDDWGDLYPDPFVGVKSDATNGYVDRCIYFKSGISPVAGLSWGDIGEIANTEVACLIRFTGNMSSSRFYVAEIRKLDGSSYSLQFANNGTRLYLASDSDIDYVNFTWAKNTWYWVRFRGIGHYFYGKVWASHTEEPGSWTIQGYDDSRGYGRVGLSLLNTSLLPEVAFFSATDAGETAPILAGSLLSGNAVLQPTSAISARISQKFVKNPVVFNLGSNFKSRTITRDFITAEFRAGFGSIRVDSHPIFKWPSQPIIALSSSLSVETHVLRRPPRIYPGDHYRRRYPEHYAAAFSDLLPTGMAWPREPTSILQRTVSGLTGIWGNKVEDQTTLLLTKESDPRSTVVLLPDWERAWGLPDKCIAEPLSTADRQVALVNKITMKGAQSREFFINQAAKINYKISISEFSPFMAGVSRCGDTTALDDRGDYYWQIGADLMRFYWVVHVELTRYTWFRAGSGQAGINHHLELAKATDLECMIQRWKPAHSVALFDYSPLTAVDISQTYNTDWLMILSMM